MTNAEFADIIETALKQTFKIEVGHRGTLCQTGENYIELGMWTTDGDLLPEMMIGAIFAIGDQGDTLYWRIRPELQDAPAGGFVRAYARFVFSQKPILYETETESRRAAGLSDRHQHDE
jgi:hypothetical protein